MKSSINSGRFVVFEGLDGAGTTTQAQLFTAWLQAHNRLVIQTAEPSKGPIGNMIRQALGSRIVQPTGERLTPQTMAALFSADRADHLACEIEPRLAAGVDVVCDRYALSSLAYQGMECDPEWVAALNAPYRPADLTIFLKISTTTAAKRRLSRAKTTFETAEIYETELLQKRVAEAYERAQSLRPNETIVFIDGEGTIEEIQAQCQAAYLKRFGDFEGTQC